VGGEAVTQEIDALSLPDDAAVTRAVARYAAEVRKAYGDRLKGVYLFGSRARGDHTPESDADLVVVLADDGWDFWTEKTRLTDLSYDFLIDVGADIQGWPVTEREWRDPSVHHNPSLVEDMRRDGRPVLEAA
jgi:uncharacterized protein